MSVKLNLIVAKLSEVNMEEPKEVNLIIKDALRLGKDGAEFNAVINLPSLHTGNDTLLESELNELMGVFEGE